MHLQKSKKNIEEEPWKVEVSTLPNHYKFVYFMLGFKCCFAYSTFNYQLLEVIGW